MASPGTEDGTDETDTGAADCEQHTVACEDELVLDLSFQSPWNLTTGWIEMGGVRRHRFRSANGRQRLVLDLAGLPGRTLEIGIVVDRPFPRAGQPSNRLEATPRDEMINGNKG